MAKVVLVYKWSSEEWECKEKKSGWAYNGTRRYLIVCNEFAIKVIINEWTKNEERYSLNWCCSAQQLERSNWVLLLQGTDSLFRKEKWNEWKFVPQTLSRCNAVFWDKVLWYRAHQTTFHPFIQYQYSQYHGLKTVNRESYDSCTLCIFSFKTLNKKIFPPLLKLFQLAHRVRNNPAY